MKLVEELLEKPQFVSPAKILDEVGLAAGMDVIDYGSGAGHWTISAAKKVRPDGRVLAIEDDINLLNLLKSKAELESIGNIDIEELSLESGESKLAKPSDLVIVSNIFHLIEDKQKFAHKISKLVKTGGKLLFIDWVPKKTLFGPPLELRIGEEDVMRYFSDAGLHFLCTVTTGIEHFGLVFKSNGKKDE